MTSSPFVQDGRRAVTHPRRRAATLNRQTANTRRVWAAVTREPNISIHTLAERLGVSTSVVNYQLHRLRDAGYITFPDRKTGARQVVVPFICL